MSAITQFHDGDRVVVMTPQEMIEQCGFDCDLSWQVLFLPDNINFVDEMFPLCGKEFIVESVILRADRNFRAVTQIIKMTPVDDDPQIAELLHDYTITNWMLKSAVDTTENNEYTDVSLTELMSVLEESSSITGMEVM